MSVKGLSLDEGHVPVATYCQEEEIVITRKKLNVHLYICFLLQLEFLAQVLCIVIMVLLNACVWRFFVKALHTNGGTLVASLVSAATNYTVSVSTYITHYNNHMNRIG